MKRVLVCMILILLSTRLSALFANDRPNIYSIANKEIVIADHFAGQSFTLIKEAGRYFIIRKFFGSGRPVIATLKYATIFNSDYQVRFSKVIDGKRSDLVEDIHEEFILSVIEDGKTKLFLNGIQVVIESNGVRR